MKEETKFAVPQVSNGCTYKFLEFQLFSEGLVSEEVAIIDCAFVDLTFDETSRGAAPDTTPLFWNIDPTTPVEGDGGMTKENRESLAGILEAMSSKRSNTSGGGLLPLTELQLTDFYPFMDPALNIDGRPLSTAFHNDVANWGTLTHKDTVFVNDQNPDPSREDDVQHITNLQSATGWSIPIVLIQSTNQTGASALFLYHRAKILLAGPRRQKRWSTHSRTSW